MRAVLHSNVSRFHLFTNHSPPEASLVCGYGFLLCRGFVFGCVASCSQEASGLFAQFRSAILFNSNRVSVTDHGLSKFWLFCLMSLRGPDSSLSLMNLSMVKCQWFFCDCGMTP